MNNLYSVLDVAFKRLDEDAVVQKAKAEKAGITYQQLCALEAFAAKEGRSWKKELQHAWRTGKAGVNLQELRNTHGPRWLEKFKL